MASFEASTSRVIALTPHQATFYGSGGALFGIYLRNVLLTLVTFGIYFMWGKNRIRTYVVEQSAFQGDRFAWHGTGKELFIGVLKVMAILMPVYFLISAVPLIWKHQAANMVSSLAGAVLYFGLAPLAAVGARRYRFSRLSWRGIRFSFRGRIADFFKIFLRGKILSGVTLGLYTPFYDTQARKFFSDNTYFGNARFSFDGKGRDLFWRQLTVLLIAGVAGGVAGFSIVRLLVQSRLSRATSQETLQQVLVLGLPWLSVAFIAVIVAIGALFWYLAYRNRYFWGHTYFQAARFRSTVTAGKLAWLWISNLLLIAATLGLAIPWVLARNMRFNMTNVALVGSLDLATVLQEAQKPGAGMESLADMLGLGGFDLPL